MPTTSPTRIDEDLFESARLTGAVASRSASQQVVHWARLGRELELSGRFSPREVREVLAGAGSYDSLDVEAQAAVRSEWAAQMDEVRTGLDLAAELVAAGRPYAELDDAGDVVVRNSPPAAKLDPVIEEARRVAGKLTAGQVAELADRTRTSTSRTNVAAKTARQAKSSTAKAPTTKAARPKAAKAGAQTAKKSPAKATPARRVTTRR